MRFKLKSTLLSVALAAGFAATSTAHAQAKWEPTKAVEFVIPAGPGGGADQMARMIQGIVTKNNLMKQSIIPVNKGAGAGAEGFLAIKEAKGDPHKIIITLSNLFTTPLATGVPFSWKEMTPVAMLALDQFVLWTNAEKPYKSAKEYIDAAKAAGPVSSRWLERALSKRIKLLLWRSRRLPEPSSPTSHLKEAVTLRYSSLVITLTRP